MNKNKNKNPERFWMRIFTRQFTGYFNDEIGIAFSCCMITLLKELEGDLLNFQLGSHVILTSVDIHYYAII